MRVCVVYVVKEVAWGLGQLMGMAHNRNMLLYMQEGRKLTVIETGSGRSKGGAKGAEAPPSSDSTYS